MVPRTITVFTGRYASDPITEHVEAIAGRFPQWTIHVVHERAPSGWRTYLRGKIRQLRRQPISYLLEVAAKIARVSCNTLAAPWQRKRGDGDQPVGLPDHLSRINLPNVAYHDCRFLHAAETLQLVESLQPWLGISIGAPILRAKLFSIPELGTINIHKSLLPNYRGMPPGFWELHEGASTSGVSIHWVAEKLDAGDLISQRALPIPRYATPQGLATRLDVLGTEVLLEVLEQIDNGSAARQPQQTTSGRLYRQPPWLLAERVDRRCWKRRRPDRPLRKLKNLAKSVVLAGYAFLWAPLRNLVLSARGKCHLSVLLYHRVDDSFMDDVSVGVEQFARQLAILQKHYDVLDLPTFLATREKPRKRPAVVITFDDGYECNYLAAVLLRRYGIPATFFLSTGMIGTDRPFPHDIESLGYRVPALNWSEVSRMARWGFHFGIHTVNHARLSAIPLQEALEEVSQAQAELEDRLNGQALTRCLAYPYGRETDISEEVRNSLDRVEVDYCFSAYGGVNWPDWESLDILRCGVDANFSDLGFRAVVEGWRVSLG